MPTFESLSGEAAIDAYLSLIDRRPNLVGDRDDLVVITKREELLQHVQEQGDALGVLIRSVFGIVVVDLVESNGIRFPFIRFVSPVENVEIGGVVCVPMASSPACEEPSLVLVESLRHATGDTHLELPRGFVDGRETATAAALRELQEETGYTAVDPVLLGTTFTDTGLSANRVAFVQMSVEARGDATPETTESIQAVRLVPLRELRAMARSGELLDGFTVQALGLLAAAE